MATTKNRDDFSLPTARLMAQRAGYICAYPDCRQLTVGPSESRKSGLTMVGIAAHITAAAPGGPRYDKALSPEERASEANGIWMCAIHGKQIDDNADRHSAVDLRRWKKQHEDWIFSRVANAENLLKHGVTTITIENVGPFKVRSTVKLGRHNVVFGTNGTGKTTLCQSLAMFSGGVNFEAFADRWRLFTQQTPTPIVEIAIAVRGAKTSVRFSEEPLSLSRQLKSRPGRLHVEVNGNVAGHWPLSLFNIIFLEKQDFKAGGVRDVFRRNLRHLAPQLGLTEDLVWDMLREELFCSTPLGFRIRRNGKYLAEVKTPDHSFFLPTENLSGSEHTFLLFDLTLKLIRSDPRQTPWLIIVDSSLFLGLDSARKQHLVRVLEEVDEPDIQSIVCVNYEKEAFAQDPAENEKWIGSSVIGDLTIHSFL